MILKCAVKRQMIQIEEKKDFVIHLLSSTIDYRLSAIGRRTFAIGHRLSETGRRTSAYPYTPSNVHRPRLSSSACCPSSEFFSVFFPYPSILLHSEMLTLYKTEHGLPQQPN